MAASTAACAAPPWLGIGEGPVPAGGSSASRSAAEPERSGPTPMETPPGARGDSTVWRTAIDATGSRILISREGRRLWLMAGDSVVLAAPVAVGRDETFRYRGQEWDFRTPLGRMQVLDKEEMPLWVPPDWHYFEQAVEKDLEPVHLKDGQRVELSDGTSIEVRDHAVGRVNSFGNWWPFTPGSIIAFDGKIFIPPYASPQRHIPKVLGTHRLILGDGYLIHGTPEVESIGEWASHGCVRLRNQDIERLYGLVGRGTPVFVY